MKRGQTGICALVAIDKPAGCSSHDVVNAVRSATGERRVGHAGTLDPFATGLLVVGIGPATRLSSLVMDETKVYEARISFGLSTATDDLSGEAVSEGDVPECILEHEYAEGILRRFLGEQDQLPPAYSAKKKGGRKAYELARAGEEVELDPVRVRVDKAQLLATGCGEGGVGASSSDGGGGSPGTVDGTRVPDRPDDPDAMGGHAPIGSADEASPDELADPGCGGRASSGRLDVAASDPRMAKLPWWDVRFAVSKGTYIRSLARDIGHEVGCGAFLSRLRRVQAGPVAIDDAISYCDISQLADPTYLQKRCLDPVVATGLISYECDAPTISKVRNGAPVQVPVQAFGGGPVPERIAMVHDGRLHAVYAAPADCNLPGRGDAVRYTGELVINGGVVGVG